MTGVSSRIPLLILLVCCIVVSLKGQQRGNQPGIYAGLTNKMVRSNMEPGGGEFSVPGTAAVHYQPLIVNPGGVKWMSGFLLCVSTLLFLSYIRGKRQLMRQQKIAEQEMLQRREAFNTAEKKLLEQASHTSRVTSLALHDARSPLLFLGGITLDVYNSTAGKVPEMYRDQLLELHACVKEVSAYAENLFAWVNLQQHDLSLKTSRIKMSDLLNSLCSDYRLIAGYNRNHIGYSVEGSLVAETQADLLRVILRNLVDNANKNTRDGSIHISAKAEKGELCITIKDTGQGMEPEKAKQLMSEYAGNETGIQSGMGYVYIKDMLKKMEGRLEVISKPGKGAAVTVMLPEKTGQPLRACIS
jgi:K+-sensing histidine kinase KdpD